MGKTGVRRLHQNLVPWLVALALSRGLAEGEPPRGREAPRETVWFEPSSSGPGEPDGFFARRPGRIAWVRPMELSMSVRSEDERGRFASVRMELQGARADAKLNGIERLPATVNYVVSRDRSRWRSGVPTYARLECEDVYPGIDLVYYGAERGLEYDFFVAPGADPDAIRLRFSGARRLERAALGDLLIKTDFATLRIRKPYIYQNTASGQRQIEGGYDLQTDGRVSVTLGDYDESLPLVIDPVVEYAQYLGGSGMDEAYDIAVDSEGNTILIGSSTSTDFPTENPMQPSLAGSSDAFVVKLDPAGTLLYATYLGGSSEDIGLAIAAEGDRVYVTGLTQSTDFPTVSPLQPELKGLGDAFVTVLDDFGLPVYSTYLGGSGVDLGTDLAVVGDRVYVTGTTASLDFPTEEGGVQRRLGGSSDAFLSVLAPTGSALERSTYLGGSGFDQGLGVTVDREENVYLTGETASADFPVRSPLQRRLAGRSDAFVSRLDEDGRLRFSTYLGGRQTDRGLDITVDPRGRVHLTGHTESTDFPLRRALQASPGGGGDAFVASLNRSGSSLRYSTYLGGSGVDVGLAIVADATGVRVVGETASPDFPHLAAFPIRFAGGLDLFLARMSPRGTLFASVLHGGIGADTAQGVDLNDSRNAVLAGWTNSPEFESPAGITGALSGATDALSAKVDVSAADLALRTTERVDGDDDADDDDDGDADDDDDDDGDDDDEDGDDDDGDDDDDSSEDGSGYAFSVFNGGPDPAEGITLMLLLPEGSHLTSARPSQGTCEGETRAVLCVLEGLEPGERATVEIVSELPRGAGVWSVLGAVTSTTPDPNPVNNTRKAKVR